jgi:hypothetical protein
VGDLLAQDLPKPLDRFQMVAAELHSDEMDATGAMLEGW